MPAADGIIRSIALSPVCSGSAATRLALDHARGLELERPALGRLDRAQTVEQVAERVDDAAEQALSDWHTHDLAGPPDRLTLSHLLPLPEERRADVVLLEVERDPDDAVLELEPLEGDAVLEAVDACDAVADLVVPTCLRSASTSNSRIESLRIAVISSGLSFTWSLLLVTVTRR